VAKATGAELVAISAVGGQMSEASSADQDHLVTDREDQLEGGWLAEAGLDRGSVTTVVRAGDPRQVLLEVAVEQEADLLVLGRSGSGGPPGFLHLGSAVEHIAHHATMPLAIIPGDRGGPTERIVLGVDGSEAAAAAAAWLATVAPALGASVLAVQVAEPFLEWTPATSPDNWRRGVEQDIERQTAGLTAAGVEVTPIATRDFYPADGLVGVASARHVDLLVLGTRGVGGFTGLRIGGVAMKVLHRTAIPLVLIPSP
jgi:nucleotide-binding universal stress UspA family protein